MSDMWNPDYSISGHDKSLLITSMANASGALQVLLIIDGNLTDNQKEYLKNLQSKLEGGLDILCNLDPIKK